MHRPDFDKYLDELENEYKSMVDVLSNKDEDLIIDCAKIANNGACPVTYADVTTDINGNLLPKEIVLTDKEDYLTSQSLVYIFQIVRKHQKSPKKRHEAEQHNGPHQQQQIELSNLDF